MGVGAITINGTSVTALCDLASFSAEFQANRLNSVCKFTLVDPAKNTGGTPIEVREQDEVLVTDDGTRIFGGKVAIPKPSVDGLNVVWEVSAVGFDCLLDMRVVQSGLRDGADRYDDDDVAFLAAFCADLGLEYATYVTAILGNGRDKRGALPTIDYSGLTVRGALQLLANLIGGVTFYVDENKSLHWSDPRTAQVVLNPYWNDGVFDNWTLDGSAAVTDGVGPGGTGDWALRTTGNGSGQHFSTQTITGIVSNRRYLIMLDMVSSVAAKAVVVLDWYNGGTPVRLGDTITSSGTAWNRYKAIYTAPSATVDRVVVKLGGVSNFTGTVTHDNILMIGETAAFGVSTTPNGTTVKKLMGWSEKREAVTPVNRLLVRGTNPGSFKPTGNASNDTFTLINHGLANNDTVKFVALTGGAGLTLETKYYVVQKTTDTFKLSTTQGGGAFNFTTNVTASMMVYDPYRKFESWRENAASISYYRGVKYEGVITDESIVSAVEVDRVADEVWRKYAFPSRSGSYYTLDSGLLPGKWQIIEQEVIGLKAIEYLSSMTVTFGGNGHMVYEVNYGTPETDTAAAMVSIAAAATGTGVPVNEPPPTGLDFTGPSQPTVDSVTTVLLPNDDGTSVLAVRVVVTQPTDTDLWATWVEITFDSTGGEDPQPIWTNASILLIGREKSAGDLVGVPSDSLFWVRARSQDASGNYSTGGPLSDGYTAITEHTSGLDTTAPAIPGSVALTGGFKAVGVVISDVPEPDVSYYEIRYAPDDGSGTGPGASPAWTTIRSASTICVVGGLDVPNVPGESGAGSQKYWLALRAVDTSGNVAGSFRPTGEADTDTFTCTGHPFLLNDTVHFEELTGGGAAFTLDTVYYVVNPGANTFQLSATQGGGAITFTTDITASRLVYDPEQAVTPFIAEAGWTPLASAVATLVGGTDIVAGSITATSGAIGDLSADLIKSGLLKIDTGDSAKADGIEVYDAGVLVGRWNEDGLIVDSNSGTRLVDYVKITDAAVTVYKSGVAVTAMNKDGIRADAILWGSMPGGHNLLLNSSFELAAWGTGSSSVDWDTNFGSDYGQTNSTAGNTDPVNALSVVALTY